MKTYNYEDAPDLYDVIYELDEDGIELQDCKTKYIFAFGIPLEYTDDIAYTECEKNNWFKDAAEYLQNNLDCNVMKDFNIEKERKPDLDLVKFLEEEYLFETWYFGNKLIVSDFGGNINKSNEHTVDILFPKFKDQMKSLHKNESHTEGFHAVYKTIKPMTLFEFKNWYNTLFDQDDSNFDEDLENIFILEEFD